MSRLKKQNCTLRTRFMQDVPNFMSSPLYFKPNNQSQVFFVFNMKYISDLKPLATRDCIPLVERFAVKVLALLY